LQTEACPTRRRELTGLLRAAAAIVAQEGVAGSWIAEEVALRPWTFVLKAEGAKVSGTVSQ
jgi:hypothetical protein